MTTLFSLIRDINGYNGFGLMFADNKYSVTLAATTVATLTIPSTYQNWIAIFSFEPGTNIWVANNATAAIPAGNTIAASTSDLNPVGRFVQGADVLSLITASTTADVGILLYALSNNQ